MQCCRAVHSDLQDTLHCLPLFCRSPVSVEIVGLLSSLDNNHIESSLQLPIQPQIICVCINPCCVLIKKTPLAPLVTHVIVHENTDNCNAWSPRGTYG